MGSNPILAHLRSRATVSFLACSSPVRRRACRSLDCFLRSRTMVLAFHSSLLFLRPYFLTMMASSLILSPCHGWEGVL